MADLTTLDRVLDAEGKLPADMEAHEIAKYEAALRSASAAIRNYTDRDFTKADGSVATVRTFEYDDSGFIDIDDATTITSVTVTFPYGGYPHTLNTNQWSAMPYQGPVKDTVVLYSQYAHGMSREMGFTWNLDRFDGFAGGPPPTLEVTAVWGWPEIPEDVQQAAVWTAAAFAEQDRSVTSESVASFSRSMALAPPNAIPLRARDLLDEYRRVSV